MIELSARVESVVAALFSADEQAMVLETLKTDCAGNIPGCADKSPQEMDRIRLSVLKLSEGKVPALKAAIRLAETDWRDLFMAAGFGHDPKAHESWWPKRLTGSDKSSGAGA